MGRFVRNIVIVLGLLTSVSSCVDVQEFDNDVYGNFEALWTILDERYCFFEYKDIDWDEVHDEYYAKLFPTMTSEELFNLCSEMLEELQDGHTNLSSAWETSYYYFWADYPQNYDERVIQENYFNYDYRQVNGMMYGILDNNMGYIYYGDFSVTVGEGNLDYVLAYLAGCDGLIIDVRDNGGGMLTNVETFVSRFISETIYAGALSHKTGPGHNDFSDPYDFYYDPAEQGRIKFNKPVVLLTNRSSYSATNNFVAIMKSLDNVRVVGDTTGGGSGMPFTSEIPNGWSVRFSACSILDPNGDVTEFGVDPSEGCDVDISAVDEMLGKDSIMERAFEVLIEMINS
ncbi:MAG: S41 family peptidase [Bacteroidales bacterium]